MFGSKPEDLSSFNPSVPHGGKGEAMPLSCPLAYTCATHTYTLLLPPPFFLNVFLGRTWWQFSVGRILVSKNDSSLWEKGRHWSRGQLQRDPSFYVINLVNAFLWNGLMYDTVRLTQSQKSLRCRCLCKVIRMRSKQLRYVRMCFQTLIDPGLLRLDQAALYSCHL